MAETIPAPSRDHQFAAVTHEFLPLLLEYHDANEVGDPVRLDAAREGIDHFLREPDNRLPSRQAPPAIRRAALRLANAMLHAWREGALSGDIHQAEARMHRDVYRAAVWELELQQLAGKSGFLRRWVRLIRLALGRAEP